MLGNETKKFAFIFSKKEAGGQQKILSISSVWNLKGRRALIMHIKHLDVDVDNFVLERASI